MDKNWYKSKTMWTGIFAIVYALYLMATTGQINPQEVLTFLSGMGLIGVRDAIK